MDFDLRVLVYDVSFRGSLYCSKANQNEYLMCVWENAGLQKQNLHFKSFCNRVYIGEKKKFIDFCCCHCFLTNTCGQEDCQPTCFGLCKSSNSPCVQLRQTVCRCQGDLGHKWSSSVFDGWLWKVFRVIVLQLGKALSHWRLLTWLIIVNMMHAPFFFGMPREFHIFAPLLQQYWAASKE